VQRNFAFEILNLKLVLMNKVSTYVKESYNELLEKVTWPNWAELQQSTAIVLVATVVIMLLVGVMDFGSNELLKLVYSLFK
jgi:preprotein translocase subunit SecE